MVLFLFFFFQAEDGIRDVAVTGVQTCALPILFPALMMATASPFLTSSVPTQIEESRLRRTTCEGCSCISTRWEAWCTDRKSTRLNSSHGYISYAVFCLKKKKKTKTIRRITCTSAVH